MKWIHTQQTIRGFLTIFLGLFAFCMPAWASDISVSTSPSAVIISVDDVIVPGDATKLEAALNTAKVYGHPILVRLNSRGGDVDEGMAMGHLIRNAGASTLHKSCSSSCVFVFMAGVGRFTHSNLGQSADVYFGVHRPELAESFVASPTPFSAAMMKKLKDYTVEMSGSDMFYDFMMQIPFSSPYSLSLSEAVKLKVITQMLN